MARITAAAEHYGDHQLGAAALDFFAFGRLAGHILGHAVTAFFTASTRRSRPVRAGS